VQILRNGQKKQIEQAAQGASRVELRRQQDPGVPPALRDPAVVKGGKVVEVITQQGPAPICGEGQLLLIRYLPVATLVRAVGLMAMTPEGGNEIEMHIMIQVEDGSCHGVKAGEKRPSPCVAPGAESVLFRHRSLPGGQNSRQGRRTPEWG